MIAGSFPDIRRFFSGLFMSQRILQPGEIEALDRTAFPRIILPQPDRLLPERAARLRHLAVDSHLGAFLRYLARLVDAQHAVLAQVPVLPQIDDELLDRAQRNAMPLWLMPEDLDPSWQPVMQSIVAHLLNGPGAAENSEVEREVLTGMQGMSLLELDSLLVSLWGSGPLDETQRVRAPIVMAAVQLVMMCRAARLNLKTLPYVDPPTVCPVCGSAPLASVVQIGGQVDGLRYLHCSVCETEWHMVRVKCSNCASTEGISYRRLERVEAELQSRDEQVRASSEAAARMLDPCTAELCDVCGSYSKVFDRRRDPQLDVLADDLGTLMLDVVMGHTGHPRAGSNPFLFPEETASDEATVQAEQESHEDRDLLSASGQEGSTTGRLH